jgi:hypothetical protein
MNKIERASRLLLSDGSPKYVRCYDNTGETIDRYTVVFTGRYTHKTNDEFWNLSMSGAPFHPQGFGQHGFGDRPIDRPTYSHLGRKIAFTSLPEDCQKLVLQDYLYLWDIRMDYIPTKQRKAVKKIFGSMTAAVANMLNEEVKG